MSTVCCSGVEDAYVGSNACTGASRCHGDLAGGADAIATRYAGANGICWSAALTGGDPPILATAAQPSTPVNFNVPAGACDCHTHIIGDPAKFPFADPRPTRRKAPRWRRCARCIARCTPTASSSSNPSFYGTDNSCMLDAIKQLGRNARGIAAISDTTSNAELDDCIAGGYAASAPRLDGAGSESAVLRQQFKAAVERIRDRPWHVELVTTQLSQIEAIKEEVMASPVPVSIDLGSQSALGAHQPGFDTFLSLVHAGKTYVNIAGPYGVAKQEPDIQTSPRRQGAHRGESTENHLGHQLAARLPARRQKGH